MKPIITHPTGATPTRRQFIARTALAGGALAMPVNGFGRTEPAASGEAVATTLNYLNFASEDTRIAAPVVHSLRRFMKPGDIWPTGYSTLSLHGN
jgi:hypothetical protein